MRGVLQDPISVLVRSAPLFSRRATVLTSSFEMATSRGVWLNLLGTLSIDGRRDIIFLMLAALAFWTALRSCPKGTASSGGKYDLWRLRRNIFTTLPSIILFRTFGRRYQAFAPIWFFAIPRGLQPEPKTLAGFQILHFSLGAIAPEARNPIENVNVADLSVNFPKRFSVLTSKPWSSRKSCHSFGVRRQASLRTLSNAGHPPATKLRIPSERNVDFRDQIVPILSPRSPLLLEATPGSLPRDPTTLWWNASSTPSLEVCFPSERRRFARSTECGSGTGSPVSEYRSNEVPEDAGPSNGAHPLTPATKFRETALWIPKPWTDDISRTGVRTTFQWFQVLRSTRLRSRTWITVFNLLRESHK